MAGQPNVTLPEPVLSAVREEAARQHKSLNEMACELIMAALHGREDIQSRAAALMDRGHGRAKETHPELDEAAVVDIFHKHRGR